MGKYARDLRRVDRGMNNAGTVNVRNRKAKKQFDRWFSGNHVQKVKNGWDILPTGHGLIHKGRKP